METADEEAGKTGAPRVLVGKIAETGVVGIPTVGGGGGGTMPPRVATEGNVAGGAGGASIVPSPAGMPEGAGGNGYVDVVVALGSISPKKGFVLYTLALDMEWPITGTLP